MCRLALIGDYNTQVVAHVAIPRALEMARSELGVRLDWEWIGTEQIHDVSRQLAGYAGIWVVPASPYKNMQGALTAIRYARETQVPFLGTCGGFQHALIEFARDVAGIAGADHAETNASAADIVVTKLSCSLVEQSGEIVFAPGSRLHEIFQGRPARGEYRCSYGFNPAYRPQFESAGLCFTGFDFTGEIRAAELPSHPFFIGTLFQPERSALRGEPHPLIRAFVRAAATEDRP
jgi:CTP synthase (UTP-ammonia lyase)